MRLIADLPAIEGWVAEAGALFKSRLQEQQHLFASFICRDANTVPSTRLAIAVSNRSRHGLRGCPRRGRELTVVVRGSQACLSRVTRRCGRAVEDHSGDIRAVEL
jgi:hypothetical protein